MKVHLGRYLKNGKERKISVKLHPWDTWNADTSIALIAAPLLKQLKAEKHGAPLVDDIDVPEELKSTSAAPKENEYDIDANHFKRWDWVLDEMIFAMQEIADATGELKFYDDSEVDKNADFQTQLKQMKIDKLGLEQYSARVQKGCELFGKYFQSLWS